MDNRKKNLRPAGEVLALLPKPKKQDKKNKNRKYGRNFRWDIGPGGKPITHSMTKYRAGGNRERNKARKMARRLRGFKSYKNRLDNSTLSVV